MKAIIYQNKYSNYIEFEEIDCSINSPNVDYVTGFPTISMYKNNKFISKYDDNRDNLENYMSSLDKEYVQTTIIESCGIMYLERGGEGICDWFLEFICTNVYGNLCIECVDKNRKRFKFEDVNQNINEISGRDITELISSCIPKFKNSFHYQSFKQHIEEKYNSVNDQRKHKRAVTNMDKNAFVSRLANRTHKDNFTSLLKLNKEREEEEKYC